MSKAWYGFGLIIVMIFAVSVVGCLGTDTSQEQQYISTPVATPTPIAVTYCRVKIVDKCKGLDDVGNDRFFLDGGWQVEVASDCGAYNYCIHALYSKANIGQEYILGMQNGIVVKVYTLQEASDSCELRYYIDGKRCEV